jgi:hypothetical protein
MTTNLKEYVRIVQSKEKQNVGLWTSRTSEAKTDFSVDVGSQEKFKP